MPVVETKCMLVEKVFTANFKMFSADKILRQFFTHLFNRLNGCNTFEGQSNCLSLFSHIHLKFVKRGQGSQLYNLCVPTFVELSLK